MISFRSSTKQDNDCFEIKNDSCADNAKVIKHYESKSKPGIGEEMHATLLYTSKQVEGCHETLQDIYINLTQVDETLPKGGDPTLEEIAEAYQKIIKPNEEFKIADVQFISGKGSKVIVATLLFKGSNAIVNERGNPISGGFLHLTLLNVNVSVYSETQKIDRVVAVLKEKLSGKTIKIGTRNGYVDLEFGRSGEAKRIRP